MLPLGAHATLWRITCRCQALAGGGGHGADVNTDMLGGRATPASGEAGARFSEVAEGASQQWLDMQPHAMPKPKAYGIRCQALERPVGTPGACGAPQGMCVSGPEAQNAPAVPHLVQQQFVTPGPPAPAAGSCTYFPALPPPGLRGLNKKHLLYRAAGGGGRGSGTPSMATSGSLSQSTSGRPSTS